MVLGRALFIARCWFWFCQVHVKNVIVARGSTRNSFALPIANVSLKEEHGPLEGYYSVSMFVLARRHAKGHVVP